MSTISDSELSNYYELDTVPDEDFESKAAKGRDKLPSWPILRNDPQNKEGPNINLKCFKKRYSTDEEKHFLFEKIKKKKKTELCKNFELYHDCYYKNECSFAHGIEELRQNISLPKFRIHICKTFSEKYYCNFGTRCNYRHFIKEKRLLSYDYYLKNLSKEFELEIKKNDIRNTNLLKFYKLILYKRKLSIPRLDIFQSICPCDDNMI